MNNKKTRKINRINSRKSNKLTRSRNRKYHKRLSKIEEIVNKNVKNYSNATPVVSMGHGLKLLKQSKSNLKQGKLSKAMLSFMTAMAVVSAVGPFEKHGLTKEQRMSRAYEGRWTGDVDELMKWHIDNKRESQNRRTRRNNHKKKGTTRENHKNTGTTREK